MRPMPSAAIRSSTALAGSSGWAHCTSHRQISWIGVVVGQLLAAHALEVGERDDPDHPLGLRAGRDDEAVVVRGHERVREVADGVLGRHRGDVAGHDLADGHRLQEVGVAGADQVQTAARQHHLVVRVGVHQVGGERRDDRREQERQDHLVAARQLEHHDDRAHRCARDAREDRRHPDQRVRAGPDRQVGNSAARRPAEQRAERRPDHERRREDAARTPRADRRAGREQLPEQDAGQQDGRAEVLVEDAADGVVAAARAPRAAPSAIRPTASPPERRPEPRVDLPAVRAGPRFPTSTRMVATARTAASRPSAR